MINAVTHVDVQSLMEHNSSCLTEKNSSGLTPFHITVREGKPRLDKKDIYL